MNNKLHLNQEGNFSVLKTKILTQPTKIKEQKPLFLIYKKQKKNFIHFQQQQQN